MNHGVVPSQRSRAKPIAEEQGDGEGDVHALADASSSVVRGVRAFVGRSFIGGDDRSTGRAALVNASTSYREPRRAMRNSLRGQSVDVAVHDRPTMTDQTMSATHVPLAAPCPATPLVMPNAWDAGSAKLFASLGFAAIATTSSGFAATLGRADGGVHARRGDRPHRRLAAATPLPVNADLEDCFADDPAGRGGDDPRRRRRPARPARRSRTTPRSGTIRSTIGPGRRARSPPRSRRRAPSRASCSRRAAENLIRGVHDLADTIARLQAYQEAGADVLYAPGPVARSTTSAPSSASVDRPVNVLLLPGGPTVRELAAAGVARVSVGGTLAWVAWGAVADAARELLADGTHGLRRPRHVAAGGRAARAALRVSRRRCRSPGALAHATGAAR